MKHGGPVVHERPDEDHIILVVRREITELCQDFSDLLVFLGGVEAEDFPDPRFTVGERFFTLANQIVEQSHGSTYTGTGVKRTVQRLPVEVLSEDRWPSSHTVFEDVVCEPFCSYKVNPNEEFAVVTLSENGEKIVHSQEPDRLVVEVGSISDNSLNHALVQLMLGATEGQPVTEVFMDRLQEYMAEHKLVQLLCHPDVHLTNGLSAIRHEALPPPGVEENIVIACTEQCGVLIKHRELRGAFLRTQKFRRVHVMSPIPTAWDRLKQDPFE